MTNNVKHLLEAYHRQKHSTSRLVLATIIESFGSTYQKSGACMLIDEKGELSGLLGGGCFERDLVLQAKDVFDTGTPKLVFYDMRSFADVIWGLGLGCNGAVRILLQLFKAEDGYAPLNKLIDCVNANQAGVLLTLYQSGHPKFEAGFSLFVPENQLADHHAQPFEGAFLATSRQVLLQRQARNETQLIEGFKCKIFYNPILPPLQLLLCGAGIDAVPVVQVAKLLGWRVTVADHRLDPKMRERFAQVDRWIDVVPEALSDHLNLDQFGATVLMTHNIELDQRYLQVIAKSKIPFIGLLGPAQRKDRLLQALGDLAGPLSNRVFGPVGLDIGAESPEEIAVSIIAGIHAAIHGYEGQQMNDRIKSEVIGYEHEGFHR